MVDLRAEHLLGIRTEHGRYRFTADARHRMVNTIQYFYGVTIDRAARTAAWQSWIEA
ncbi:hypothetical protein [Actinokineospora enzanensis]|uniref:hypothetical protein n=1 Tax=Actinokineospora enzanensis TaxID=155975 RepID=UPI000364D11C|nr:hypothetical protein [Actinokineospora enzanensis]